MTPEEKASFKQWITRTIRALETIEEDAGYGFVTFQIKMLLFYAREIKDILEKP